MENFKQKNYRKNNSEQEKSSSSIREQEGLNEGITQPVIQLISDTGENLGKMATSDALQIAYSKQMDLVIVLTQNAECIPVAKIMNYSKKLYEDKKKNNAVKKKKHETKTKELRVSPKISDHDLQIKMNQGAQFLLDGYRVKLVLIMKGRERGLKDTLGVDVLNKASGLLSHASESSNKHLVVEQDSDSIGSVCKIFYLRK